MNIVRQKLDEYGARQDPAWLIDATPGAREALNAWREHMAGRAAVLNAWKRVNAEVAPLGKWHGVPGNTTYGPADGVTTADFDAGQVRKREAEAAVKTHDRRAAALRRKYDDLIQGAAVMPPEDRRKLAAAHAVSRQADVVAAFRALSDALEDRDMAWLAAGQPGYGWWSRNNGPANPANARAVTLDTLAKMVEGFDVDAAERAAAGEDVTTLASMADQLNAAAREANARVADATRARSRAAGY